MSHRLVEKDSGGSCPHHHRHFTALGTPGVEGGVHIAGHFRYHFADKSFREHFRSRPETPGNIPDNLFPVLFRSQGRLESRHRAGFILQFPE